MNPRWVPKSAVLAMHERLIAEHGGAPKLLRDEILESSLAEPRNLLANGSPDLFALAAKYASSLILHHPFHDGNKRIALTVAGVFLELNGHRLEAPEPDTVAAVLALSTGTLDEEGLAAWLRLFCTPLAKPRRKGVVPKARPKRVATRKRKAS